MIVLLVTTSFVFTYITEKRIMPKLPRVEYDTKEIVITNRQLRELKRVLRC